MTHPKNNAVCVLFGSFTGIIVDFSQISVPPYGSEALKVFLWGIIGGIGGYVGKKIADKVNSYFKRDDQS